MGCSSAWTGALGLQLRAASTSSGAMAASSASASSLAEPKRASGFFCKARTAQTSTASGSPRRIVLGLAKSPVCTART